MKIKFMWFKPSYTVYGLFALRTGQFSDFNNYHWRNCSTALYFLGIIILVIDYRRYIK